MNIKRLIKINGSALALVSSVAAFAQSPAHNVSEHHHKHGHCRGASMLTPEQRTGLQQIRKDLRVQLVPLFKEKRALRLQMMGKIATSGMQWNEVVGLIEKSNDNQAKINTLIAKSRFETYQKFGVMLPLKHHHHHQHKS